MCHLHTFYLPHYVIIIFKNSLLLNFVGLKSFKICWEFPNLTVQPGSHCKIHVWQFSRLLSLDKCMQVAQTMYVSFKRIKNLYSPKNYTMFLLVPPEVLVIMDDPSNFQDFLSFLNCIDTTLTRYLKYKNGMYSSCKLSFFFKFPSLLRQFLLRPILNHLQRRCMYFILFFFSIFKLKIWQKKNFWVFHKQKTFFNPNIYCP